MLSSKRVKRTPELPPEILLEIFEFCTFLQDAASIAPLDPFVPRRVSNNALGPNTPTSVARAKCTLVLVCHAWRRIALQLVYQHIVIRSPSRADKIYHTLHSTSYPSSLCPPIRLSEYGRYVRHIEVYTYGRGSTHISYLQRLFQIFAYCPNLRLLTGYWTVPLPKEFLDGVAKLYGDKLKGISWTENWEYMSHSIKGTERLKFVSSFQNLHVLDLCHFTWEMVPEEASSLRIPLPQVQEIVISGHNSSLYAASSFYMPSLQRLNVKFCTASTSLNTKAVTTFLEVHGNTLESVHMNTSSTHSPFEQQLLTPSGMTGPDIFLHPDLCPNLSTLTFPATVPKFSTPDDETQVHYGITRVGITSVKTDWLYPDKPSNLRDHLRHFTGFKHLYPNVQTIRTIDYLADVEGDTLIKDIFIWWAEKFEKYGVDFQDGEGVVWAYTDSEE